jgi:hypothetical protein
MKPRYKPIRVSGITLWHWSGGASNNAYGRWPMVLTCRNFFVCTMRQRDRYNYLEK